MDKHDNIVYYEKMLKEHFGIKSFSSPTNYNPDEYGRMLMSSFGCESDISYASSTQFTQPTNAKTT